MTGAWRGALVVLTATSVCGCALRGPDAVRGSRLAYNEAVQTSEQRELLLNIVRLRYNDAPEFLAISGIASQMNFAAGASIGGEFGEVEGDDTRLVASGAEVGYSETPTVTFVPQRDKAFTRQLVAPVEIDNLYLLTHYGWSIENVLRLLVGNLNGLSNSVSRSGEAGAATLVEFAGVARELGRLEAQRLLHVDIEQRDAIESAAVPAASVAPAEMLTAAEAGYRWVPGENAQTLRLSKTRAHYVLRIEPAAWQDPAFRRTADRLRLTGDADRYEIDPDTAATADQGDALKIRTRSVLGTMAYVSNGVEVPEAHQAAGLVMAAGDVETALADLFRVQVYATPVEAAFVSVPYRGYWFYIDATDLPTRETLGLLSSLIRLTITAGGAQSVPVLTLPVSP